MKGVMSLILLFSSLISYDQSSIKGKIIDAISKQPLEYVSVSFDGGNTTTTDQYGIFQLYFKERPEVIIISYVGYRPDTININGRQDLDILLTPDIFNLKDIVLLNNSTSTNFSTLSKIDLNIHPVRNTQELLQVVPGLFIAQHAGGGKAEQIFLRGFDADHGTDVQVNVDGMPVNMVSHAHGQGYADAHFVIPETINNVDFGAGPYYAQQGNLNTAGYINFKTFAQLPASRVQVEVGNFDSYRALAMINLIKKGKGKHTAWVASEYNFTNGPTESKQSFRRSNIVGKYNFVLNKRTLFTVGLSSFSSEWDASGQIPERAVEKGFISRFGSIDPSEGGFTERHNGNFFLSHQFANGALWENQAYYSRYKFNLYSNFTFFLKDSLHGDGIKQSEDRNLYGYLSKIGHQYFLGDVSLKSVLGMGVRYDAANNSTLAKVINRRFLDFVTYGNIKEANAFAFIDQRVTRGKWLINAGVRFDYFHFDYVNRSGSEQNPSQSSSIVSPKLSVQYTVSRKLQLYLKTGKGFHSNDARVVVVNKGKEILPAAYGADFGVIWKPSQKLFLNASVWYLFLAQEFVYVGDEGVVEPGGKTRREGIDLVMRYQFSDYLFASMNVNFTKPRAIGEKKGEDYIPLAPNATSLGGVYFKARKRLNGGLSYRYIRDRPASEDNSIVARGYLIMDASINFVQPKYEIGMAFENLWNNTWNEAQFATTSRLRNEPKEVTELHFTPGTPFFARLKIAILF